MNSRALEIAPLLALRPAALLAMCVSVSLSGCALIHNDDGPASRYDAARATVPAQLKLPRGDWPDSDWWKGFSDQQLDALIEKAFHASPTMAVARQHVAHAHSQSELVAAVSGAQVNASGTIDRERVSSHGFLSAYAAKQPSIGANGPWYTTGLIGFDGAWNIDIWGLHRAEIAAAMGEESAQKAEAAETRLELSSDVARLYYVIQAAMAETALLDEEHAVLALELDAHAARFARGLESRTVGEQAEAHEVAIEQEQAEVEEQITEGRESLRALIGATGGDQITIEPRRLPVSEAGVPAELGFQLLARRPDLQALSWYASASLNRVDAARAAFYPNLNIKVFFGFDALDLSQLFLHSSQQINVAPGLYLPIFDGGRLNASLKGARASSNALILQYNQAVLDAVSEVAKSGSALQDVNGRIRLEQEKLEAVRFTLESVQSRYATGLADRLDAEQAREPEIEERLTLLRLQSQQIQNGIALTKTLGGGYASDEVIAVPPSANYDP
jgi:multidrug efflux system outer membrane protein